MQQDVAEEIALKALAWVASDEELLGVFLGASGLSAAELKARASESELLVAVLDFLTMDDRWVMAFCDSLGLAYDTPLHARNALPGGAPVHWT